MQQCVTLCIETTNLPVEDTNGRPTDVPVRALM